MPARRAAASASISSAGLMPELLAASPYRQVPKYSLLVVAIRDGSIFGNPLEPNASLDP